MTTPTFSVIMNTYNGGPWIRQAIDSVLAQSFADWELIIWDDGSTDDTPAIAASYTDPRIRVFPTTDRAGLGKAREKAARVASGQWLAFLDQDDLWEPSKLRAQHDRILECERAPGPPLGICYTRALRFNSKGPLGDFDHHHLAHESPEGDVFQRLFTHSCFICMSAVALKREAVLAALPMPEYVKFCPDYYLYLAISRTHRACAVPDQLCRYRIHDKNMSVVHRMRINHEIIRIVEPWKDALPAGVFRRRLQIHQTLIALDEIRDRSTRRAGLMRLLRDGSVVYLFERPFARAYRALRRPAR
jgi:glycosyltransferase involved in cell wall biosynthesis